MRAAPLLMLLISLPPSATAREAAEIARPSTFSADQIRSILRDKVDRDRRSVGMLVGVVDENGSWSFSHGRCCTTRQGPLDGDSVFEIGSLTKPFTQALLAAMVARGQVRASDPISRYLPPGVRAPAADGGEITLQHLADHTSGLPRMPDDYPQQGHDYPIERLYAFLGRFRPTRAVGAQREYSNVGYGLLAHLLSRAGGKSYEELIREHITGPLGMNRTFVRTPRFRAERFMAEGHDAELVPRPSERFGPVLEGAGGISSTMNDLLRFLSATMRLRGGAAPAWGRVQDVRGKPLILHDGSTPGFGAYIGWDPARRRGVVVLANANHVPIDVVLHLLQPAAPLIPRRSPASLPRALLDTYTGTFRSEAGEINLFRYNDRLFLERNGQPPREIYSEAPGRLFIDDARPILVEDGGEAPSLRLYQLDGGSVPAIRTGPATARFAEVQPSALAALEGDYEIRPGLSVRVTRRGAALFAQVTAQSALELVPLPSGRFRYLAVAAEIEFNRDASGAVSGLTIFQDGEATPAQRVANTARGGG